MNTRQIVALLIVGLAFAAVILGAVYQERQLAATPAPTAEETSSVAEKAGKIAKTFGPFKGAYLAKVHLSGPIEMKVSDSMIGDKDSNAVKVKRALNEMADDDKIKGVLIEINSPGGTVGMSQELHAAVERLREKKPVVAHFGDVAASGGYYTAAAADRIVSNPGALTASIGVIISSLNFQDLMNNKLGVKAVTIKSGKHKDMLSPYRAPDPADIALLQEIIDTSYQQFLGVVLTGRTKQLTDKAKIAARKATLRTIADGRVMSGEQALKAGVVDALGDTYVAHGILDTLAKERFNIGKEDRLPLETYKLEGGLLEGIMLPFGAMATQLSQVLVPQVAPVAAPLAASVPLSSKYPNQPLWIME